MDIYRIKDAQSRANFEHVLQTYYAKNYKACILLLYDLTVNDLYRKLLLMNDSEYANLDAEIDELNKIMDGNGSNKYSEIEKKIFKIYKKRQFLGDSTIDLLEHLQKIRDMCAHPFIFGEKDYMPEAELVFAFISKIYNDILSVGAFFKKPYEIIGKEIDIHIYPRLNAGALFIFDKSTVEDEVRQTDKLLNKYFKDFTDDNLRKIFNTSLDLIISKQTEDIQKKQYANFLVLNALLNFINNNGKNSTIENCYNWSKIETDIIKDEKSNSLSEDWLAQTYLYEIILKKHTFLNEIQNKNHDVFELLESSIYNNAEYFIRYWTIFESDINIAIKKFKNDTGCENYCKLLDNFYPDLNTKNMLELFIKMFSKVPIYGGYDDADKCLDLFLKIVEKDLERFPQDSLSDVFVILDNNRQIYDKLNGFRLKKLIELGYDFASYDNIKQMED